MSEQMGQGGQAAPGGCGCGGHGRAVREERSASPAVVQPLGEGYRPPAAEPQEGPGAGAAPAGVVPGRKAGNLLGLRDVSVPAPSQNGGCGCGGHGGGHGRCGSH